MKVCVIPARAGSKRIKDKNIRSFFGKPIIGYSIEKTLESGLFDKILVSTDSSEIAGIAEKYGAEVPFMRPKSLSGDHAPIVEVMAHACSFLTQEYEIDTLDLVSCVFATNPFIENSDLIEGVNIFLDDSSDYVVSLCQLPISIERALLIDKTENTCRMNSVEHMLTRSQDLATYYYDAAHFYIGSVESWSEQRPIFNGNSKYVVIPEVRVRDIDTEEDWEIAETLYKSLNHQKNNT